MKMPRLVAIEQKFPGGCIKSPAGRLAAVLESSPLAGLVRPGWTVGITAGSRGIEGLALLIKKICDYLRGLRANPVVVCAMGAHGGATARGQIQVLESLGVTEASVGAPVKAADDGQITGRTPSSLPVWTSPLAMELDCLLLFNRVKPHTHFAGPVQSGLLKMACIGLGGRSGARNTHRAASASSFAAAARDAFAVLRANLNIAGGIALVENAYGRPAEICWLDADEIVEREPGLLEKAAELMPRMPLREMDALIIDEIGKDISGTGFDTNLAGRKQDSPYRVGRIFVRGLSRKSLGNACGIGLADCCTRKTVEQIDRASTYANTEASGLLERAKLPMVLETDREAIMAALDSVFQHGRKPRVVWVRNTRRLDRVLVSEGCLGELGEWAHPVGAAGEMKFAPDGSLIDQIGQADAGSRGDAPGK